MGIIKRSEGTGKRVSPLSGENKEPENFDILTAQTSRWKWILFGSAGFVFVFLMSFFFAALYVHKKEALLVSHQPKQQKIVFKQEVKPETKHVIKRYELSPFFLRVKDKKTGGDDFLSAKLYIEFVSRDLPAEIKTKKELLRTLIYRQLKKHFVISGKKAASEEAFKKELVPALNIFFKGGGVYAVGFDELIIR